MASAECFLVAIFLLTSSCLAHEWNTIVSERQSVSLNCSDPDMEPFKDVLSAADQESITWLLPGEVAVVNASREFFSPLFLEEEHRILRVANVTKETSGVYYCALNVNGTWYYIKRGITFVGEPFTSLLEEYKPQLIRAGIAAGSYLFIWIFLSLVYTFRYREEEPAEGSKGHWNRAMSFDNDAVTSL